MTMVAINERNLFKPSDKEIMTISELLEFLHPLDTSQLYLEDGEGRKAKITPTIGKILVLVIEAMTKGKSVAIMNYDEELTTQQAADLLNVSRPYLIKLLERGEIPFHRVGTHRRIYLRDLLEYKKRRDQERRELLNELIRTDADFDINLDKSELEEI